MISRVDFRQVRGRFQDFCESLRVDEAIHYSLECWRCNTRRCHDPFGHEFYSGVILLGSTPFRSWGAEIVNPWLAELFPCFQSTDLSDLCSTARDFTEVFTFRPDTIHPATKLTWIGAYALQHPTARINYITRTQDEDTLKVAAGKIAAIVLLGKEDSFLLPSRVEELYKESFSNVKAQIWPEVGHLPFFEEPEKTRDAILSFVKGVNETQS